MVAEASAQDSPIILNVDPENAGARLDRFVSQRLPEHSRSYLQTLIERAAVKVDGAPAKVSERLRAGQQVSVEIPPPSPSRLVPTPLPLAVVYEDEDVLVIDKPAGLVVHPAPGHPDDTLSNAIFARYPGLRVGVDLRPGIVHRLDKDTSGLMVVAKNDRAMEALAQQMTLHNVLKEYLALVEGELEPNEGIVEAPIGRDPLHRQRMAVVANGKPARTHFRVLERIAKHSLLRVRLETGRTHQIRVHFSSLGHPVEGDRVYGRVGAHCSSLRRQFLHAARLGFQLPAARGYVELTSDLPADLQACLVELGGEPYANTSDDARK